jgi:RNA polymerase sigma-B factor
VAVDRRRKHLRDEQILRHSGLVRGIARRYAGRGIAMDDLVQTGYLGLIQAVDRFDAGRGVPLHGYAARMIEGEILHLLRDHGWSVRVPRPLQELGRRAVRVRDELAHQLGREPDAEEIAEALDETAESVLAALNARSAYQATPLNGDDSELDGIRDRGLDAVENRDLVERAMRYLPERERWILEMRFQHELSQAEIAERVGISQMHVSRLLRASLERLNRRLIAA